MAQIFHRSTNTLSRVSIFGAAFFVAGSLWLLAAINRSGYVTGQGVAREQPVQFSHKHHAGELGIDCRYCHAFAERSSYAGVPPTQTCMNCHAQIWTNAQLLEPVRQSWATGQSIQWIRVHDLPDYVYFNHDIHVNKGIGCASCHGRVDEMPLMYMENTLQMEWCLNCHRNPAVNLRPTSEIYNMAWEGPSTDKPVWCGSTGKAGPTAGAVNCTTVDPTGKGPELASLQEGPAGAQAQTATDAAHGVAVPVNYQKFTDQIELGKYLTAQYHIRTPNELSSCETCHR